MSAATVRRDLELLEEQRLLTRTHGGAVAQMVSVRAAAALQVGAPAQDEKRRIGRGRRRASHDGAAVGLTGGTTTTEVARAIARPAASRSSRTPLNIASELAIRPNMKLVVTGGVAAARVLRARRAARRRRRSTGLHLDRRVHRRRRASTAATGLTTHHEIEAHTDRALIDERAAWWSWSPTGRSSAGSRSRGSAGSTRCDELITDADADPGELAAIRDAGLDTSVV